MPALLLLPLQLLLLWPLSPDEFDVISSFWMHNEIEYEIFCRLNWLSLSYEFGCVHAKLAYAIVGGDTPAAHSCHFKFRLLALFANHRLDAQLFLPNQYAGNFIWFGVVDSSIGEFDATIQWQTSSDFQELLAKSDNFKIRSYYRLKCLPIRCYIPLFYYPSLATHSVADLFQASS